MSRPDRPCLARIWLPPSSSAGTFTHLPGTGSSSRLASRPLKRKPLARGTRAPRAPTIVGSFCRLPWRASVVGSVAPVVCPLVLVAARAPLGELHGDAQSDSRLATTPDGRAGMETAEPSPMYDVPARLLHGGPSDSLAKSRRCSTVQRSLIPARRL